MKYDEFKRETHIKTQMMYTDKATVPFNLKYSGYIGIMPLAANGDFPEKVYLKKLKMDGIIEHLIVAFYTRRDSNVQSSIKFGGWD